MALGFINGTLNADDLTTASNPFALASVSGLTMVETGSKNIKSTTLTMAAMPLTVVYDVTGGFVGLKLGDFPVTGAFGSFNIIRYGCRCSFSTIAGDAEIAAAAAFRLALGTTQQTTANGGELAANTFNIMGATGADNVTLSSRTVANTSLNGSGSLTQIAGTTARALYMNIAGMDHTTVNNGVISVTGTAVIQWGVC